MAMDDPELEAIERRAAAAGRAAFGAEWRPVRRAIAPGRIELLGNHLDYNGGPVLAAAIDRAVVVLQAAAPAGDSIRVVAADVPAVAPATLAPDALRDWRDDDAADPIDFARGVVAATLARPALTLRHPSLVAFAGDVPIGFGLSSSAALCVALALALAEPAPPFKELVLLAQEAEHRLGAPVGTMDQSASVAGGVIEYDGAALEVRSLAPELGDLVFAVADSGVDRSVGASAYPTRVEESKAALAHARRALGGPAVRELPHLAALTAEQLETLTAGPDPLPEPLLARARHVVSETARVHEGAAALRAGDWPRFGALMTASGRSSATDYAISHPRVEELVAETLAVAGVLGARMMGGGEGGTALTLLPRDRVPALEAALRAGYYARHAMADREELIHVCEFAPGARLEAIG
jgi:galactokinase